MELVLLYHKAMALPVSADDYARAWTIALTEQVFMEGRRSLSTLELECDVNITVPGYYSILWLAAFCFVLCRRLMRP